MPERRLRTSAGLWTCWAAGLALLGIVGFIVVWVTVQGVGAMSWSFLSTDPTTGGFSVSGGIRAPIVGTLLLVAIGTAIALPVGLGTAIFLSEYRQPKMLARLAESSIEVVFGVPSIIFALFGVAVFTNPGLIFLSSKVQSSGLAYGKSFLTAGTMMALLALPLIVRSAQEAMASVSQVQREASYALGKSKLTTIRRIVLPQARAGIATGTILGIGRIAGDTAIVLLVLGGTLDMGSGDRWYTPAHWLGTIRDTGSTLTSYTYGASPAGEYNATSRAFGAAFVLILLVILVNAAVTAIANRAGRNAL